MALIEALRPDVLVKGADYRIEEVVGADLVQSYGGTVVLAELMPGHSTTATITEDRRRLRRLRDRTQSDAANRRPAPTPERV